MAILPHYVSLVSLYVGDDGGEGGRGKRGDGRWGYPSMALERLKTISAEIVYIKHKT